MTDDKKKILIIEDTLTYQQGLKREFVKQDFLVQCVGSGEDGLHEVKKFKPDLIVLDLLLPGIGGREVCRQLKMDISLRHIPVMMLTMKSDVKTIGDALESGADSYVSKNESMDIIVRRAQALVKLNTIAKPFFDEQDGTAEEEISLAGRTILVVDDDITFLQGIKRQLQESGYHLVTAMSGRECFERLYEKVPDVVLLDLRMPEIDGVDVCRQIRKIKKFVTLPILMLTASDSQEDITRSFEAGVNDYVVKSGDLKIIDLRVYSILRRKYYEEETRKIQSKLSDAQMKTIVADAEKEAEKKHVAELTEKNSQLDYLNKELQDLDRLKSEFVSTVSHELRTPLVAVGGMVTNILLGVTGKVEGKLKDYLEKAAEDIKRLDRLIINLLDFSKIEKGKLKLQKQNTDICALVGRMGETLAAPIEDKKIVFKTQYSQDQIFVYMDADRIIQVLTNLIHNAIKFTPQGGEVSVLVTNKSEEKLVEVVVMDSGIGIPADKIKTLFQRFVQIERKFGGAGSQGTGLGLAISKGIVDSHKGNIWIESDVGQGSKFIFTLPLYDAKAILADVLERNFQKAENEQKKLALIIVDTDFPAEVEKLAKDIIRRQDDTIISCGEKSMAIILYGIDKKDADAFLGRFKEAAVGTMKSVFGIAMFPDDAQSADQLIEKAWGNQK